VNLPSFIWLWRIAAWSMGLAVLLYICLGILGGLLRYQRLRFTPTAIAGTTAEPPSVGMSPGLRWVHQGLGMMFVLTVLELLTIGIVGTLGHFGSLGHSPHLWAGLSVVTLALLSAWSANQIRHPLKPWARSLHLTLNGLLFFALAYVSWTGWTVVQKYLP
jgi:hypothetical protein